MATIRTNLTPEEQQLVELGWQPSGFTLWIHPLNERTQNTVYYTPAQAIQEVTDNRKRYEMYRSYESLLEENNNLKKTNELLRHQLQNESAEWKVRTNLKPQEYIDQWGRLVR